MSLNRLAFGFFRKGVTDFSFDTYIVPVRYRAKATKWEILQLVPWLPFFYRLRNFSQYCVVLHAVKNPLTYSQDATTSNLTLSAYIL